MDSETLGNQQGQAFDPRMVEMLSRLNQAMEQIQKELSVELEGRIREIRNLPAEEQEVKMKELGNEIKKEALGRLKELKTSESQPQEAQTPEQKEEFNKLKKETQKNLRKLVIAAEKGVQVVESEKGQKLISKLADQRLTDQELINIFDCVGDYLTGKEGIAFSKEGETLSSFEKQIKRLESIDSASAHKLVNVLVDQAAHLGKTQEEIKNKFGEIVQEADDGNQDFFERDSYGREMFSNFTESEKNFIKKLDNPRKFLNHIEEKIKEYKKAETDPKNKHYHHLKDRFQKLYKAQNNLDPSDQEIEQLVNRQIRIEVSEAISGELTNLYNQLYKRLLVEGASKQFEEVENEDFMRGILAVRHEIFRKLQRLENEFRDLEKKGDNGLIKLYKMTEEEYYTEEFEYKGQLRPVPRLRPIPYFKEVGLSDYMISMQSNFIHWRERMGYLHNVRMTYGHPPREGSFYKGLAGYAEHVKGDILDQMMHLPDGRLILEAYQLYEKFIEEEYARIDWRLRPNMFMNQFEEIHTQLEKQIIAYFNLKYGDKYSETEISHAINNAVGMARGIFLTEPEKNAYADPLTAKELGLFASYGTNDAGSLDVFNPLHTIMRWKGEPNLNMIYFMPVGAPQKRWNHAEMWENMNTYMESYSKKGGGRETRKLLIDELINITKVGGVFRRGGWRDFYQFESHYVYDGKKGDLKLLDSFKAMDMIGFEAINYFLKNIDDPYYHYHQKNYLGAKVGTDEFAQKEELFKYLFGRYFYRPFEKDVDYSNLEVEYQSYIKGLEKTAVDIVKEKIKEGKLSIPMSGDKFDEAVRKEISSIFINRTISRVVALRFPSKFLRIDKDRFNESGKSSWREIYEKYQSMSHCTRDEFDLIMKDLSFSEMLFRGEMSQKVEDMIYLAKGDNLKKDIRLGDYAKFIFNPQNKENFIFNENTISDLLLKNGFNQERIEKVKEVYRLIKNNYLTKSEFIDNKATDIIKNYPYSFGVEDTDLRMIAFRGTGPRMIGRSIGDVAHMEEVVDGLKKLPQVMRSISIDGKHDFSQIIEYMMKCKGAFEAVHGIDPGQEYLYKVAGMVINFYKKDSIAKPLFGIFGFTKLNSIAAEYAGRSTAVWEWDSRDIDRFCVALESYGILHRLPYDKSKGPVYEDRYINILGKRIQIGKKLKTTYDFNTQKLRKEFGGDWKAIAFDMVNQFLPLVALFILWEYIKKALEEAGGKKK